MCHSFATIRSKHACPIGHVHQESDDDKVTGTDIGIIVGTIGGAMLIGAVIIFIIVVVLVVIKKVKRSNSPSSVYSDMIGAAPSYDPVYIQNNEDNENSKFITPGFAEV